MLNLQQLKTFVAVVESRSFTQAAKSLLLTQPAVSTQIKTLEEILGVQLLERVDRRVLMTPAGEYFYPEAKKLLRIFEETLEGIGEFREHRRSKLTIGASTIPGEYLLPGLIGQFKESHPGFQISMTIGDTNQIVQKLLTFQVDIGIIGAYVQDEMLEFVDFMSDELILVASTKSSLSRIGAISLTNLLEQTFVMREIGSGTRMTLAQHLADKNIAIENMQIAMELGSTQAILSAVEANLGLSFVSRLAAKKSLDLKRISEISINDMAIRRQLYIVVHKARSSRSVDMFVNFLQENILYN